MESFLGYYCMPDDIILHNHVMEKCNYNGNAFIDHFGQEEASVAPVQP